jgi:hypothetical protein
VPATSAEVGAASTSSAVSAEVAALRTELASLGAVPDADESDALSPSAALAELVEAVCGVVDPGGGAGGVVDPGGGAGGVDGGGGAEDGDGDGDGDDEARDLAKLNTMVTEVCRSHRPSR